MIRGRASGLVPFYLEKTKCKLKNGMNYGGSKGKMLDYKEK
jgi:hypothetical protein